MRVSPDGTKLLSYGLDCKLALWALPTGEPLWSLEAKGMCVDHV